jgi:hypothetical protein
MAFDFVADDDDDDDDDPLLLGFSVLPGTTPDPFAPFFRRVGRLCFGAAAGAAATIVSLALSLSLRFRTNAIVSFARTADPELTTQ